MPQGKWLNAEGYAASIAFPSSALAGEYLARNLRYLKDRKRLDGRARRNELREQDRVAFAADWGILYREDGSTPWAASAYPGALFLTQPVAGSIIGKPLKLPQAIANGACRIGEVTLTLIDRKSGEYNQDVSQAFAVLIPLDELIDVRLLAIQNVADEVRGKTAKPFPPKLSKARQDRLVAGLRALDARAEGASYRKIAAGLNGAEAVQGPGWKTHDLRDRTIRLVRDAVKLMRGGYRQLLLHPNRGRLIEPD
jgi:Uncharacterized conserved protein (DUF2285)